MTTLIKQSLSSALHKIKEWPVGPHDQGKAFCVSIAASLFQAVIFGTPNAFPSLLASVRHDKELIDHGQLTGDVVVLAASLGTGLYPLFSLISGPFADRFGPRTACFIAVAASLIGLIAPSYGAKTYTQLIGIYGIFVSIGVAFGFAPSTAVVSTWFVDRKSLGIGIMKGGGGVSMLTITVMVNQLLENHDWRYIMRRMAWFQLLAALCAALLCFREAPQVNEKMARRERKATKKQRRKLKRMQHRRKKAMIQEEDTSLSNDDDGSNITGGSSPSALQSSEFEAVLLAEVPPLEPDDDYSSDGDASDDVASASSSPSSPSSLSPPPSSPIEKELHNITNDDPAATLHCRPTRGTTEFIRKIILTRNFVVLWTSYALFSVTFYGVIYIATDFPMAMGAAGTIYEEATAMDDKTVSYLFIAFGITFMLGSVFNGYIATRLTDRYTFALFIGLNALVIGCYSFARRFCHFCVIMAYFGWATGAFYSTFPSMLGKRFYGPNLGLAIGWGYSAAAVGGFGGPFAAKHMSQDTPGDNYTYCIALFAAASAVAALLVLVCLRDRIGARVPGQWEESEWWANRDEAFAVSSDFTTVTTTIRVNSTNCDNHEQDGESAGDDDGAG